MKYIKIFWIIAISLFIIPFLGFPQGFKDFLIILIACIIGFVTWVRSETRKLKKQMLVEKNLQKEKQLEENTIHHGESRTI